MNILAVINSSTLLDAIIWIVVAGVIFWLLNWFVDYAGIKDPFNKVAKVIIALVAVVLLIKALLIFTGVDIKF